MTDHTPAPWRYDDLAPLVTIYAIDSAYGFQAPTVCVVGDGDTDYSLDASANELVANVNLIAAAPDLLAALETLYALVASEFDSSEAGKDDPMLLALAKAQHALIKAQGGQA